MGNIININLSEDLIASACEQVLEAARSQYDMSNCAVVFGGKRPALFARQYLFEKISQPFLPPKFYSMDELMWQSAAQATNCAGISSIDAAYAIFESAKECAPDLLHQRESFKNFLPWANEIFNFIEELEIEMVPQELLSKLSDTSDIGFDGSLKVNKLLTHIAALKQIYQNKFKQENKFTRAMAYSFCAESLKIDAFKHFDKIIFCGLFYLHKSEKVFIKKLYDTGKVVLIFQGSALQWEALGENAKYFACKIEPQSSHKIAEPKLICATDLYSQAILAKDVLHSNGAPCCKSALILPDSNSLMPVLSEVAPSVKKLNVSCGYPLRRTPFYSLAQNITELLCSIKDGECRAKLYVNAISHPLIKSFNINSGALTRIAVHKIEEVLSGKPISPNSGKLFIDPQVFQSDRVVLNEIANTYAAMGFNINLGIITGLIEFINKVVFYNWKSAQTLYDLCCAYETLIKELSEKSRFLSYPQNVKAGKIVFDYIDELKMSSCAKVIMPQEELCAMFLDLLGGKTVSFKGTPLNGLQVLGFLESRSINFENVVLIDVNEAVLPNVSSVEPLIPAQVRASLKLKSKENEEEIQRYHFTRLLAGAKNSTLIYIEDGTKERSRFIEQLLWAKERSKGALIAESVKRATFSTKIFTGKSAIAKTKEVCEFLENRVYSASSLNTYLQCPVRFYFQYVLGLKEKEEVGEELDSSELGTAVHGFLQESFKKFIGLKPNIDANFRHEFFDNFDNYFKNNLEGKVGPEAFLLHHVLSGKLEEFLDTESNRQVDCIIDLEKTVNFNLELDKKSFAFTAIIDRIDQLSDGSYLILDYKTGALPKALAIGSEEFPAVPSRSELQKYVKSFQLPMYIFAVLKDYQVKEIDAALWGLKQNKIVQLFKKEDNETKEITMSDYKRALKIILEEIVNPKIPFEPDDLVLRTCANCPYNAMC
ncbi:MAG: PD-(D/E)XK nuclease family protein [Endomicrobiales bacterium]|nr:PD-(D/E)XK nuclease family protein [Endomicrobiales bacterium]